MGSVLRLWQNAARAPAASPMFHSTGCSLYAPFDMCVVPMFLHPAIRFSDAARIIWETMSTTPELQVPDPEFDAWADEMAKRYG